MDIPDQSSSVCDDCSQVLQSLPESEPSYDLPFTQLAGERVLRYGHSVDGTVVLTRYRLYLQAGEQQHHVPLGLVETVEHRELFYLQVSCKDARTFRCTFENNDSALEWYNHISKAIEPPKQLTQLFAFVHFHAYIKQKSDEQFQYHRNYIFDKKLFKSEMARLRFSGDSWRISEVNVNYKLCATYPPYLLVPSCITDETLESVAKFRSSRRIPAVVWRHTGNGAVIARCSQPEVGWLWWRSNEDEDLIKAISYACNFHWSQRASAASASDNCSNLSHSSNSRHSTECLHISTEMTQDKKVLIMDARSYTTAVANRARGGGCECPEYYPNCEIQFMNLANIHSIRKSFHSLRQLCTSSADQSNWFSQLESTRWLLHMSTLMKAAVTLVNAVERDARPVLVHCSDGWDRTPQIVALAELLLDPHYRTMEGFRILVEREWLAFGHKFSDRCGHTTGSEDVNERCPVFLQWLDCIHQLHKQFSCAFEFSHTYLVKLAQHTYSNLFGTFLCNTQQERKSKLVYSNTFSVWDFLNTSRFKNHLYAPASNICNSNRVLWPQCNVRDLCLWTEIYLGSLEANSNNAESSSGSCPGPPRASPHHMTKTRSYGDLINTNENGTGHVRRSSDPSINIDKKLSVLVKADSKPQDGPAYLHQDAAHAHAHAQHQAANIATAVVTTSTTATKDAGGTDSTSSRQASADPVVDRNADFLCSGGLTNGNARHTTNNNSSSNSNNVSNGCKGGDFHIAEDERTLEQRRAISAIIAISKSYGGLAVTPAVHRPVGGSQEDRARREQLQAAANRAFEEELHATFTSIHDLVGSSSDSGGGSSSSSGGGSCSGGGRRRGGGSGGGGGEEAMRDVEEYVLDQRRRAQHVISNRSSNNKTDADGGDSRVRGGDGFGDKGGGGGAGAAVISVDSATVSHDGGVAVGGGATTTTSDQKTSSTANVSEVVQRKRHENGEDGEDDLMNLTGVVELVSDAVMFVGGEDGYDGSQCTTPGESRSENTIMDFPAYVRSIKSVETSTDTLVSENNASSSYKEANGFEKLHTPVDTLDNALLFEFERLDDHRTKSPVQPVTRSRTSSSSDWDNLQALPKAGAAAGTGAGGPNHHQQQQQQQQQTFAHQLGDDGLMPLRSVVQERLQEIIDEHKRREEMLQRELHIYRLKLAKQVCHKCNYSETEKLDDNSDRENESPKRSLAHSLSCSPQRIARPICKRASVVESVCSAGEGPTSAVESLRSDMSWEALEETPVYAECQGPLWVPDYAVSRCMGCDTKFWLGRRKHHCRKCGRIFCADCSENQTPLPSEQLYNPVRVCTSCYSKLRRDCGGELPDQCKHYHQAHQTANANPQQIAASSN